MMYLDANFFLFAVLDPTRKGVKARKLFDQIRMGKSAVTSPLALDEVMWILMRKGKSHLLPSVIPAVYATPNLEVRDVPATAPLTALRLLEQFPLESRDAMHLAIMEHLHISTIVSDDRVFDRVSHIQRISLA